jgi:hypothetical protein
LGSLVAKLTQLVEQSLMIVDELAMEQVRELRSFVTHLRLLEGGNSPKFCVVLKESWTFAVLVRIPKTRVWGDIHVGAVVPLLDGSVITNPWDGSKVFRAMRKVKDGRVSY